MDGVWIDRAETFRRRWLCRCGNQRPDDMAMCGSCDTDRPQDDARDVFALCDAVEALEKDRERLDWLEQQVVEGNAWFWDYQGELTWFAETKAPAYRKKHADHSARKAIDAAISHTAASRVQAASTPTPAAPSDA